MKPLSIATLIAIGLTAACGKKTSDIHGNWEVNIEPMIHQAQTLGASAKDIQGMKETFDGGKLLIDDSKLTMSVAGISGS